MKVFLTISFIFFSIFSTIVETQEFDLSESTRISKTAHDQECKDFADCTNHKTNCHDSNCYGSAHFGHGFYYQGNPFALTYAASLLDSSTSFVHLSHNSLVYLENLFRPPLHLA